MELADFDFDLPDALIARHPTPQRTASRLLHLRPDGAFEDSVFSELGALLSPGDLLVLNDTRVLAARLYGRKSSGGRVELLLEQIEDDRHATAQIRASHAPRAGAQLLIADDAGDVVACARVLGREDRFFRLRFDVAIDQVMSAAGHVPLPPYIDRADTLDDRERYQTVYARHPGAVAAPTAGLHFDEPLLDAVRARGVELAWVTLHVAAGTFQPLTREQIAAGELHAEQLEVNAQACEQVRAARERGGRVVAVGTTSLRALESAARAGSLEPFRGETRLFVRPGYRFRVVDGLITNFHLPKSSLMMLVAALGGRERMLAAYAHAVRERYRFFSYGDAMLIWPEAPAR